MKEILSIISFYSGILILGAGFFVFFKDFKRKLHLIFLLYCLSISIWLLSTSQMLKSDSEEVIIFWDRLIYSGVVFIPIFVYHFGVIFCNKEKEIKNFIYLGYFLSFIFLILSRTDYFISGVYKYNWGVHTQAKFLHHFFLIYFSIYIFLFFYEIYKFIQKEKDRIKQLQAKYLFLSFITHALGSYAFLPAYGIDVNPLGAYLGVVFGTLLWFFSITKYHLFEIRVILTEILVGVFGILLLFQIFIAPTTWLKIFNGTIFILFSIFGYLLIRYTHQEIHQKEILEEKVKERTKELEKAKEELEKAYNQVLIEKDKFERLYKATLGREMRIIELKEEVRSLKEEIEKLKEKK